MIKNLIVVLLISVMFIACNSKNEPKENEKAKIENMKEIPRIDIGEFDAKAGDYVGKEVKVSGIVDHVCKHGGKKILLVSDKGDVHVNAEKRFDENLVGKDITVIGIVKEFRVDESYCLKMEKDNIKSHKGGSSEDDIYKRKMKQIQFYRDSMKKANVDHLSFYSLDFVSLKENK